MGLISKNTTYLITNHLQIKINRNNLIKPHKLVANNKNHL
jgi:hypothetical protein